MTNDIESRPATSPQADSKGLGVHQPRSRLVPPDFWDELGGATLKLAAVFWFGVIFVDSVMWGLAGINSLQSLVGKVVLNSFGAILTVAISIGLYRLRMASVLHKVSIAFAMSVAVSPFYAGADALIYKTFFARPDFDFDFQHFLFTTASCNGLFFGWSGLYIALLYSFDVRDRERKLAAARQEAITAQMRALRYQINPHFLFNTMNSIAGLIEEEDTARAKQMVIALSTFLRNTLELDPHHDVTLAEELALQHGYLQIEQERFSDRMRYTVEAGEDVQQALVPSLILQPLVENAIKHGVGRSAGPVDVRIGATRIDGGMRITVENSTAADRPPVEGFGIGLQNVAERVAARFGSSGRFVAGMVEGSVFRAEIEMPWRTA